jgi:rhodanese-related sulfurtransferase
MQIFSAISGIINEKVITLITFSIPTKMSKLMKAFFAGICLFFSTLVSCQQKGEDFESVSTDEFATLIADPDIQRLDVRTVAEYSEEHISGSININVLDEQFAVIADSTLQKDKPIALYCRSGKRSKKAATILSRKGYKVYDLDKGFIGWKEAGKETEK